jgi:acyl carrier protein
VAVVTLRADLAALICRHVRFATPDEDWAEASLRDLGLDSMSAIDLVLSIEDELGIVFPDELLVTETFETALALQAAVASVEAAQAA